MFQILCGVALLASVCSGCNQARRDSTWFTDRVPTDTKDFQADAPGLQCWQCDGSFVKHERRTCLRIGERKQNCDGSVQYCELRLRVGYRNYIHAERGDMPAERQVTWRGCARDWITEGDPYQNDQGYQTDPSYPPGMKCKRTGILRSEEKRPNYIKAIRKWDKGLVDTHSDLLALASFTAAAEKANQIMAAGKDVVSDVSATMAASRDKMTGVLSNAVTSLHRRTGSGRVVIDKKVE